MELLARIRVHCPDCLDVRIAPTEVSLRVCMDNSRWSYWFTCPGCGLRAASATGQRAALDAIAAGAPYEIWRLPAEMLETHEGPPLSLSDLVDLQLELRSSGWLDDGTDVERQEI